MPTPAKVRDAVAKAIYETHLPKVREQAEFVLGGMPPAPTWEAASADVRKWVLAQADSAIAAATPLLRQQLAGGRPARRQGAGELVNG